VSWSSELVSSSSSFSSTVVDIRDAFRRARICLISRSSSATLTSVRLRCFLFWGATKTQVRFPFAQRWQMDDPASMRHRTLDSRQDSQARFSPCSDGFWGALSPARDPSAANMASNVSRISTARRGTLLVAYGRVWSRAGLMPRFRARGIVPDSTIARDVSMTRYSEMIRRRKAPHQQ
jgi:hypothetical protein